MTLERSRSGLRAGPALHRAGRTRARNNESVGGRDLRNGEVRDLLTERPTERLRPHESDDRPGQPRTRDRRGTQLVRPANRAWHGSGRARTPACPDAHRYAFDATHRPASVGASYAWVAGLANEKSGVESPCSTHCKGRTTRRNAHTVYDSSRRVDSDTTRAGLRTRGDGQSEPDLQAWASRISCVTA